MSKPQGKIVIRKVVKKHGHAHHGGSWKVAYADFVTAMMAFFMVMWILGMSPEARASIQSYFSNPAGVKQGSAGGRNPLGAGGAGAGGATTMGRVKLITRVQEVEALSATGRRIEARLKSADGLQEIAAQVEVVMTEQGLRIELVEEGRGETFFAFGDATLKPAAAQALGVIAPELTTQPVVLEGHTDSAPFGRPGYTNWELSADRANAARRALENAGVGRDQVVEVRGYADRRLRVPDQPLSAENRRLSILLPFTTPAPPAGAEAIPGGLPVEPAVPGHDAHGAATAA